MNQDERLKMETVTRSATLYALAEERKQLARNKKKKKTYVSLPFS